MVSPASNGGRGLKLPARSENTPCRLVSPASNGGRGLKQNQPTQREGFDVSRPPVMAGVD